MVKEYLQENIDALSLEKDRLVNEKNRLNSIKNRLHASIVEIQERSDVDFEIFSPRAEKHSSKGRLNEMYQQMNSVKKQLAQISRELEEVSGKLSRFEIMYSEVESLEKKASYSKPEKE